MEADYISLTRPYMSLIKLRTGEQLQTCKNEFSNSFS